MRALLRCSHGLRAPPDHSPLSRDPINARSTPFDDTDLFTRIQGYVTKGNHGPLGDSARESLLLEQTKAAMTYMERLEHVSVLCAANTISMALLIGIIFLQVGEWYTEEALVKPLEERIAADEAAAKTASVTAEKKTQ